MNVIINNNIKTKKEIIRPVELIQKLLPIIESISYIDKTLIKINKNDSDILIDNIHKIRDIINTIE
jgi:hypothetical protein